MKISNKNTPAKIISKNKATPEKESVDLDAISVFMDNDAVSLGNKSPDPDIPDKEWHFQISEPSVPGVLKAKGFQGRGSAFEFSIIHTNDEHDPDFSKFAKETTIIHKREKYHGDENSFIVNTGDLTYESSNDKPGPQFMGPVADIFKAQGMEYFVPGNHEFQHGGKWLEENFLDELDTTALLGNVTYKSDGKPLENTKPFVIKNVHGVNVGIIGLTTDRQKTKSHPNVGYDVNVDPVRSAAEKLVPQVKEAGADLIIVIAHEGIERVSRMASYIPGIDVVIAGHDHKKLTEPSTVGNVGGGKTLVVEASSHARYVGDLTLDIDPESKKIISAGYKLYSTSKVKADPKVEAIVSKYYSNR